MEGMRQGLDFEKAEAALKRAADKALRGTREERSGRFLAKQERAAAKPMPRSAANNRKADQK
jgi:hypothetical protein